MSDIEGSASLKGKIRHLAKEHDLKPQEVLQMYLFEHLLKRLTKSPYADKFVLKGGFLISSMTGIRQRTTMDMDATVVGLDMDEKHIARAMVEICDVDVGDGMSYIFERVEPIRADDEYANWRAHLKARYGKINAPVKVDITTGDIIYPSQIWHRFQLMFGQGTLDVLSYHPATILAEKLETVISRGETNTRGRDFYDLYILPRFYLKAVDADDLRQALVRIGEKRGSRKAIENWSETVETLRSSAIMHRVWNSYAISTSYAKDVVFEDALESIERLMHSAGF